MAAKTPVAVGGSGYVPPFNAFTGVNAVAAALITNGTIQGHGGFKLEVYAFADIDDTDTWTSNIQNIAAVAWQADQADTDKVGASVTTQATGVVTFDVENANSTGWLWVLRGV